jgi:hypothetical protein
MPFLRLCLVLMIAALCGAGTAQAQLFGGPRYEEPAQQPRASQPRQRRSADKDRQYVPPQPQQQARRPSFFERLFPRLGMPAPQWTAPQPPQQQRPLPKRARPTAPAPDRPRSGNTNSNAGGGNSAPSERAAAPPPRPKVEPTTFVAVLGDSLADNLAGGLTEVLAERPEVALVRQVRPGVGFLKDTDKPWKTVADEVLARDPAVVAAVVMLGPYDDPPAKTPPGDPAAGISPWTDLYATRVDDITLAFRQKGIPLLWVGLSPVSDPVTNADNAFVNELVQQRVTALGGTFIDVWEGFVDDDENYTANGPDLDGQVVRLRMPDGVHFTKAGARKLAHYVELELRDYLLPKEEGSALADVAKEIQAVPVTPGSSRILLLGEAPRTPGAVLVPAAPTPSPAPEIEVAARALTTGEAVPPKPGRADDFSWGAKN